MSLTASACSDAPLPALPYPAHHCPSQPIVLTLLTVPLGCQRATAGYRGADLLPWYGCRGQMCCPDADAGARCVALVWVQGADVLP